MNLSPKIFLCAGVCLAGTMAAGAQDILQGKPIYTLGEPKTWTAGDASYTFVTEDLKKLVATPVNTSNVFLYPENGTINTPENQAIGAQGFYIDLGASKSVDKVSTTWEGAAADEFDIYLTNTEPTIAILETEPTYAATGLGQYQENTVDLPKGAAGRYLVFQPIKATNWGWGVKIRSIHAYGPTADVLTTFTVSPGLVKLGETNDLQIAILNQYGLEISEGVEMSVKGDGDFTLEDNRLTITSGTNVTFTATLDDVTLTAIVYAITKAPGTPKKSDIFVPIYTNTVTDKNSAYGHMLVYNGGADDLGEVTFSDGKVARLYGNARCIFFYNQETTGAWDADINPVEHDYGWIRISIFPAKDCTASIVFERTTAIGDKHDYQLTGGEWNVVTVALTDETLLHTMSVRLDQENMTDLALANIYFVENKEQVETSIRITADTDFIASDEPIVLSATVLDQLGGDMVSDKVVVYNILTEGVEGEIVDGVLTIDNENTLNSDSSFTLTVEAALEEDPEVNGTIDIRVIANTTNQYISALTELQPSAVRLNGETTDRNPFAGRQIIFDMDADEQSLEIEFEERHNFSLLVIEWEAACPSDFTIHTVKQYGHYDNPAVDAAGNPILADPVLVHEVTGRSIGAAGVSRIDRIYYHEPSKNETYSAQLYAVNETPVNSNALVGVKKLIVTPTAAANSGWGVKLNSIKAYGSTTAAGDTTGVEDVTVEAAASAHVDVYTITGALVRKGVERESALDGLGKGIYVVGGQKMIIR